MIRVKFGPNPQKIKEVEVTPSQKDSLIPFMKTLMKEDPTSSKRSKKKGKSKVTTPEEPVHALLLVFCNVTNKIRKRTDTAVAFTQEYSRVSYPLGNVSTLPTGSGCPRIHTLV